MTSFVMNVIVLCVIVILAALFHNILKLSGVLKAPYGSSSQQNWWERPDRNMFGYPLYSYWESFANPDKSHLLDTTVKKTTSPIMEYPPDSPGPADLYNNQPYHLLSDILPPPRPVESISCVNSRSCYAVDFDRMVSKTGTFRQMTNNYKRGYPDSCSSPYQELVLNFYKADPMAIPANNTGGSVSEVNDGL
jgi:hypothetical protein